MQKSPYIVISDDELYHWKYIRKERRPGGGWRYYYKRDGAKESTQPTGMNYSVAEGGRTAENNGRSSNSASSSNNSGRATSALMDAAKKADRYIAIGREWLDSRLYANVIDTISGRAKTLSWAEAAKRVDEKERERG